MILAETPDEEEAALEALLPVQRADFVGILEAMDGLPVTIRLLDPPLHEFLPRHAEILGRQVDAFINGVSDPEADRLMAALKRWEEANPMLGTRGCRLGILKPGLYRMQVRAIIEAAVDAQAGRRRPAGRDHDPAHRRAHRDGAARRLGARGSREGVHGRAARGSTTWSAR